jgi:2-hydroxychromene-2-carboxylate isomerase
MQPAIEFWFDFGSNYSYLTAMRIENEAAKRNVKVIWKPFLLGPIFKDFGWSTSPFVLQKEKGKYTWRDMERQSQKYSLPWTRPSVFPRAAILPMRVAIHGADEPWLGAFSRLVFLQNFADDMDIASEQNVRSVLGKLNLQVDDIITTAQSEANKVALCERRNVLGERPPGRLP